MGRKPGPCSLLGCWSFLSWQGSHMRLTRAQFPWCPSPRDAVTCTCTCWMWQCQGCHGGVMIGWIDQYHRWLQLHGGHSHVCPVLHFHWHVCTPLLLLAATWDMASLWATEALMGFLWPAQTFESRNWDWCVIEAGELQVSAPTESWQHYSGLQCCTTNSKDKNIIKYARNAVAKKGEMICWICVGRHLAGKGLQRTKLAALCNVLLIFWTHSELLNDLKHR